MSARQVLAAAGALAVTAAVALVLLRPIDPTTALRVLLVAYVTTLGWLVATYAATNLRGQPRTGRFAALLVVTVAGLLVMVSAVDFAVAAVGWTVSGAATAALVAHRGDARARRGARLVAGRLAVGDVALWAAVAASYAGWDSGAGAAAVSVLLAGAILVRSALAPVHRWLPETAEAPSPVSALLHAGVVNGGAMLGLLFWPLLAGSRAGLVVLVVAGLASVGLGAAAMRLRPDVKGRLAGSTTAQMGLVAVQLGLALPAAALLHVLGHGCWKAWLFLRAGGSVGRTRLSVPGPGDRAAFLPAPAVGAAVVVAGLAASTASDGLVLPAALAAAVAAVGVVEATRLERVGGASRTALAVVAALVPAGYVAWVGLAEHATRGWFGTGTAAGPAPALVALAAAGLVVAVGLAEARLRPDSSGPVATAVAASLLPPGAAVRGAVGEAVFEPDPAPGGLPVGRLGTVVELAATAVGPAWPLRSLVAANPLAPLEKLAVEDAAATVRLLHGRDPRPALSTFVDLHARGVITASAIRRALTEHDPSSADPQAGPHLGRSGPGPLSGISPADLAEFTRALADQDHDATPLRVRACDSVEAADGTRPAEVLDLQAAAWSARSWGSATVDGTSVTDPWSLWRRSAAHRTFDLAWQVRGVSDLARTLPDDPEAAIAALWPRTRSLVGDHDLYTYLASAFAAGRGWAAHARWRARTSDDPAPLIQLAALQMALDVVIAEAALRGGGRRTPVTDPRRTGSRTDAVTRAHLTSVWQRALDLSARDRLLRSLAGSGSTGDAAGDPAGDPADDPAVHSVWCIDARSERIRRHLEHLGGHQTYGFAGFFGAAVRHRDADGHLADLCPGILRPAASVEERPDGLATGAALRRLVTRVGQTPAAAFAWAEMSGAAALAGTLCATLAPDRWRSGGTAFAPVAAPGPGPLPHELAVDAAEGLLVATGLVARLDAGSSRPQLVVLAGHRSSTENNAFASAYDCGACGGNGGEVNAALVAAALNDPLVRSDLAERGVVVPPSVVAVAAVHDTTTDRVTLLRRPDAEAPDLAARLDALAADLDRAGAEVAAERGLALPVSGRTRRLASVPQRAADWAEPMPEWGLAGTMALVVGPRSLTEALDLRGTTFLHSYDAELDPDGLMLEQIMTGPVVVTHWISSQYYFSAAAPDLLGAGDKTTHNVVGDVGVITGAHGDLRTGLPWQAVAGHDPAAPGADTTHLRHVPARHLVVVAADPARVAEIVRRHAPLHEMFGNGWTQLVVLAPDGRTLELDRHLAWQPCPVPAGPRHAADRESAERP